MKAARKNPTYRQKVRLLQESDNQCAFCDFSDSGRIQFHHIDEDPSNTILTNLISVCPNCHSSIGEGEIARTKVQSKKKELESELRSKKRSESVNFNKSTLHNSVIGNNNLVTINVKRQVTEKKINKYPADSIGQDSLMYNYSKYLADRYAEYKEFELKQKGQKFNYASFYGKVKKDFRAGGFFHIPQCRFFDLVTYLQQRIDKTMLARINKGKGRTKNYISFEEYETENGREV